MCLPQPWTPAKTPIPLVIYGASSAVGAFAVKLARLSNIHPIIAIAGKAVSFVQGLIDPDKGDLVLDYRKGVDETVQRTHEHLAKRGHGKAKFGFDAGMGCEAFFDQLIDRGGTFNLVLPSNFELPGRTRTTTIVGSVHHMENTCDSRDLGMVFSRFFTHALQAGTLQGHPYVVRPNGLAGLEEALKDLKANKASAEKYVFRIGDTPQI